MSLKLPTSPGSYSSSDQAQLRGAIERADQQNRKTQEDIVLAPNDALVFWDEHGVKQRLTGAILGALVRSDFSPQGLSDAEKANARNNIGAGGGAGGSAGGLNGQIQFNSSGGFGGFTLGGDASVNVLTGALTLASVNADVGTYGDATHVAEITFDAKGRALGVFDRPIAFPLTSFNTRLGAITLTYTDVVNALGYTPAGAASLFWGFAFEKDLSAVAVGASFVDFSSTMAWTLAAGMPLCDVRLTDDGTAPSAQTDFDLRVNAVSVGTIRFAPSATAATFIKSTGTNITAPSKVQIFPPAVLNGMAGRLYGSIVGTR